MSAHGAAILGWLLALTALVLMIFRQAFFRKETLFWLVAGTICLAASNQHILYRLASRGRVAVMVDLSASTRGAAYRDHQFLQRRIAQLVGSAAFDIYHFGDRMETATVDSPLVELPGEATNFKPPACDAILLFGDGRMEGLSPGVPVYPVVDPSLDHVSDASVTSIERRGNDVAITVHNAGQPRTLSLTGVKGGTSISVAGDVTLLRPIDPSAKRVSAEIDRGDDWPENDSLSMDIVPERFSERWWVGTGGPPAGFRRLGAEELPSALDEYLAPALIVLSDVSAASIAPAAQDRLREYVEDLGGSLIIRGGAHAFGAGAYSQSTLGLLSPLDSRPPKSQSRWLLLVDASGSMNEPAGAKTRWELASRALVGCLDELPTEDSVDIGQFSDVVRWWSRDTTVEHTAKLAMPPVDAFAHGPTNLAGALNEIAALPADGEKRFILLTDGDAEIGSDAELAARFASKHIHLHLVSIGEGTATAPLAEIARLTGGSATRALDATKWSESVRDAARNGLLPPVSTDAREVEFVDSLRGRQSAQTKFWNRTWLKASATLVGQAGEQAMIARWQRGSGQVFACAAADLALNDLYDSAAAAPSNPDVRVLWKTGSRLHVLVDAENGQAYLNGLSFALSISTLGSTEKTYVKFEQTGPGQYDAELPAPRTSSRAEVTLSGRAVDQIILAGRYAPEFDAVGNDRAALASLAERSAGAVIDSAEQNPIDFHFPQRSIDTSPWLVGAGLILIGAGLLRRRSTSVANARQP